MNIQTQTIADIEEVLDLFCKSFDAFYEALKVVKIEDCVEQYDWVDHNEDEGYQTGSYYEVTSRETVYIPLTDLIDYFSEQDPCEEF